MTKSNVTKSALETLPSMSVVFVLEELYASLVRIPNDVPEHSFEDVRRCRLVRVIQGLEGYLLELGDALYAPVDASKAP